MCDGHAAAVSLMRLRLVDADQTNLSHIPVQWYYVQAPREKHVAFVVCVGHDNLFTTEPCCALCSVCAPNNAL
jgi:hypothetical protein